MAVRIGLSYGCMVWPGNFRGPYTKVAGASSACSGGTAGPVLVVAVIFGANGYTQIASAAEPVRGETWERCGRGEQLPEVSGNLKDGILATDIMPGMMIPLGYWDLEKREFHHHRDLTAAYRAERAEDPW